MPMVERLNPIPGAPQNNPAADIDLPDPVEGLSPIELNRQASEIGGRLIDNPLLLTSFVRNSQERRLMAEASQNHEALSYYNRLLQHIERYVGGRSAWEYDWVLQRNRALTSPEAGAILDCLADAPKSDQKERLTEEQRVVQAVAKGYTNGRFEKGRAIPDWRGALIYNRQLLAAALNPDVRLDRLSKWFDLTLGNYQRVSPRTSVFWRAIFLGTRSANPVDEQYLQLAYELQECFSASAILFGRTAEVESNLVFITELTIFINSAVSVYDNGLDPTQKLGRKMYEKVIRAVRSDRAMREKYGTPKLSGQPASHDLFEVARLSAAVIERYNALEKAREKRFQHTGRSTERLNAQSILAMGNGKLTFPYSVILAKSPLHETILALQDKSPVKRDLYERATAVQKERGTEWTVIPFAIKGMGGYMVVKAKPDLSSAGRVKLVSDMLDKYQVADRWESIADATYAAAAIDFKLEEAYFVITREAYIDTTQLGTYLEMVIPDELTRRSLEILRTNLLLQMEIPGRFTRMSTREGDYYGLFSHRDMPNVIRSAVIRKSMVRGGLEFEIGFAADPSDFPGIEPVSGSIDFRNGRVNVGFADSTPKIATGQRWILENMLLQLLERSCCPLLQEVEEEVGGLRIEGGNGRKISIPGHIVHIGVCRTDGTMGQPTLMAEYNLRNAIEDLFGDAEISLGQINEQHKREDPDDPRYLTYNKGFESEAVGEPVRRSPPEKLIVIR